MKPIVYLVTIVALVACNASHECEGLGQCKAIVEEIKNRSLPNDSLVQFYVDNLDLDNGLSDVIQNDRNQSVIVNSGKTLLRGMGRGHIYIFKTNLRLMIFIETCDKGHAGEYGYAYSSEPNKINWDGDNWGEFWKIDSQIDDHWWQIYFDLG